MNINSILNIIMFLSIAFGVVFFGGYFILRKKNIKFKTKSEDKSNYDDFEKKDSVEYIGGSDIIDTPSGGIIIDKKSERYIAVISSVGSEWYSASIDEKVSRIRSEIARTGMITGNMQIWQYPKSVDLDYQIEEYEKRKEVLEERVLNLQADFEEMQENAQWISDDDIDIYYEEVKKLRKKLYSTDQQRKNVCEQLEYLKKNSGKKAKQESSIVYVYEWIYDPNNFTDELDEGSILAQAEKELRIMGNKHMEALASSSVYAKRMSKFEIVEAIRKQTHPMYYEKFDLKKILDSSAVDMVVDSDSLFEYEQAQLEEEKENKKVEQALLNLNPEKKKRYDEILDGKISIPVECKECKRKTYIYVDNEQYGRLRRYLKGEGLIQDMLFDLSVEDREILLTGVCKKCQTKMSKRENTET